MAFPVFASGDVLNASDMNAVGLWLITEVDIAAAATTNINNCFSSSYRNYLITSNLTTSANTGISVRLRASGSDNSTSNYNLGYRYGSITGVNNGDQQAGSQAQWNFHQSNLNRVMNMNLMLFDPQTANNTTGSFNNFVADNSTTSYFWFVGACSFNATTQFDGFSIYTGGAPTISGRIRVYGMRNT